MIAKPKLLIATDSFLPRWDGISRFLSEIVPKLRNYYDITIIAPKFEGKFNPIERVNITRVPLFGFRIGDYQPPKLMSKLLKEHVEKADIIWVQTIGPIGALAIRNAKKLKKPVIAYIHSFEWELVTKSISTKKIADYTIKPIIKSIAKNLYNRCNIIMVPSAETAKVMEKHGIKSPKVIVKLGTDTEKFLPPGSKEEAKEKIGVDKNKKVIGFCGRIGKEKDLITLYKAFLRLEKIHKNLVLLIVGQGIKKLERLFKEKENIRLIKKTSNVVPYLQAMDIYVLPSLTETTSLSTLEAMSCGIAVIVTKVGHVKDYIKDKDNGLFFPKHNNLILSMKIDWLLKEGYVRKALGVNARKTVIKNFSWEQTVNRIKKVMNGFS